MNDGTFTKVKKILTFVFGILVLWASIVFSKNGFEFKTNETYAWVGWVLAFAATCAEFMMNSSFRKFNWTIFALGIAAYIYSIWTNVLGFQSLRGTSNPMDFLNISGAIFMDVFPEVAIAWALEESKVGDVLGNIVKTISSPEQLTKSDTQKMSAVSTLPKSPLADKLPEQTQETRPNWFLENLERPQPESRRSPHTYHKMRTDKFIVPRDD
jgi:hypothetical protein